MSNDKTVEHTWEESLRRYPPMSEKAGSLSTAILASIETNKIPLIKIETILSARTLLGVIADRLGRTCMGLILKPGADLEGLYVEDVEELKLDNVTKILKGHRLVDVLREFEDLGFTKTDKVWGEGEYSVIGDTVVVWAPGYLEPARLEFFGDRLEKLAIIDPETRREKKKIEVLEILNRRFGHSDIPDVFDQIVHIRSGIPVSRPIIFAQDALVPDELTTAITILDTDFRPVVWEESVVKSKLKVGWNVWAVVNGNFDRVEALEENIPGIKVMKGEIEEGFKSDELHLAVFSEQELWGTVRLPSARGSRKYAENLLLEINPGDYVVHEDHGVAVYAGIKELEKDGATKKYLELKYAEKDRLLVPFAQVKKLTKYVGIGSKDPVLTRLGGGEWRRIKSRAQGAVQKIAAELLRLYALRELTKVQPIESANDSLAKMENDFEFVETEDQLRVIEEVKHDLSQSKPMDRLLVGDVGFGKTEVAMRAAFLTVLAGKQVAVLAPTTILVEQHFDVFRDRMEKYGVKVAALSRFLDKSKIEKTIQDVSAGKVDIVVGTHRLLSKDISFKNLGLIVLDEEQKFGVSQKERLKSLRVDAHVLSMSATPIPRTLNMALSGVRDISVIATAPEGRKPIENFVQKFDWDIVKKVITTEVSRGGQVYFVHNRVQTIEVVRNKLSQLLPDVRFCVGHGRQSPEMLSKVMREFNDQHYDVLICTTIIENGLDMPNVNTLIVDRAEMFGLAQLYQLRGRIGRGKRQGYAYFFYQGTGYGTGGGRVIKKALDEIERARSDGESEELAEFWAEGNDSETRSYLPEDVKGQGRQKATLWRAARMRLDAIRQLQALGSGFMLAQRDLEIRGVGNFLGKEQHGNVSSVGFSLYCSLLEEAIREMKKREKG